MRKNLSDSTHNAPTGDEPVLFEDSSEEEEYKIECFYEFSMAPRSDVHNVLN